MIDALAARLVRHGSLRVDEFVELALYDPDGGFFAAGGGAGRGGADFVTSPEVGPLFGAVVARHLDRRWEELGRPDPFVVVEAAAGRGALAIAVLAARPACSAALRYVLVERSAALRARHAEHLPLVRPADVLGPAVERGRDLPGPARRSVQPADVGSGPTLAGQPADVGSGPLVCSLEDLPAGPVTGVVIANELLDNLPFRLVERADDGWCEVRVALDSRPELAEQAVAGLRDGVVELLVPADPGLEALAQRLAPEAPRGARVPVQQTAGRWLRRALDVVEAGSVVVLDYCSTTPQLARRPIEEWLRTYRGHQRGGQWTAAPGSQDVTVEVAVDQLALVAAPSRRCDQATWLRSNGIEELVDDGRRLWRARAGAPDLEALRARSRGPEAEALLDPEGLGSFDVLEWDRRR